MRKSTACCTTPQVNTEIKSKAYSGFYQTTPKVLSAKASMKQTINHWSQLPQDYVAELLSTCLFFAGPYEFITIVLNDVNP